MKIKRKLKMIKLEYKYHKKILASEYMSKESKREHILCMIFRRCPHDNCNGEHAYLQHSNCAYVEELSNYNFCCKLCHEEIDAHYQEMWDEYNSSRL